MEDLKSEKLEIKVVENSGVTIVNWLGKSDAIDPGKFLNPYLEKLISYAKGKRIISDYTKLEYMNSSTVPPIVKFIKACSLAQIELKIMYKKDSDWQNASFIMLKTISKTLNSISVEGV